MPGWLPEGMGLEALSSALTTSAQPVTASGGTTTPGDPAFEQWMNQFPFGISPVDLFQFQVWLQQNDPNLAAQYQVAPGPFGLLMLLGLAHQPQNRDVFYKYWSTQIQKQPTTTTPATPTDHAPTTAAATGEAGNVPNPFPFAFADSNYGGYNYGDQAPPGSYPSGWHEGQDYGVKDNTPLMSPFAGKIRVGYDPSGYGNYVDLVFGDQGNYLRFAHLGYVTVKDGDTITPGQQLGFTGSTGYSTGPHLLIEERNAKNQPLDPRPLISAIFNGGKPITFQQLVTKYPGIGETGTIAPAGTQFGYEITPDGHTLFEGTPDRAYYDMIAQAYSQRYGTMPPYSLAMAMKTAGVVNTSQLATVVANWPSDIPGLSFGQRDNIYNTANGIATKQWGRPIPDSLVKRLAAEGLTAPDDIKLWFDSHISTDIPAAEYQQIYDAAAPPIQSAYGEPPSPDYIGYLWGKTQPTATTPAAPATAPPTTASPTP